MLFIYEIYWTCSNSSFYKLDINQNKVFLLKLLVRENDMFLKRIKRYLSISWMNKLNMLWNLENKWEIVNDMRLSNGMSLKNKQIMHKF